MSEPVLYYFIGVNKLSTSTWGKKCGISLLYILVPIQTFSAKQNRVKWTEGPLSLESYDTKPNLFSVSAHFHYNQPIRLLLWAENSSLLLLLLPWTEHHLLLCFGLLIVAFSSQCRNTLNYEDSLLFLSIVPSQRSFHVNTGLQIRSTLIWLSFFFFFKNVVSQPVRCVWIQEVERCLSAA